jgi:hypothetical protein
MRLMLVTALVLCTCHQPLSACINDSATQADEQQFASGYGNKAKGGKQTPAVEHFNPTMLLLVLPSLALLGVGFFWMRQERALIAKKQRRMGREPEL